MSNVRKRSWKISGKQKIFASFSIAQKGGKKLGFLYKGDLEFTFFLNLEPVNSKVNFLEFVIYLFIQLITKDYNVNSLRPQNLSYFPFTSTSSLVAVQ